MGTSEPLADQIAYGVATKQDGKLIVVYCLHKGCQHTCYHGINRWELSSERLNHIERGDPSMMGPYCPMHNPQNRVPKKPAA